MKSTSGAGHHPCIVSWLPAIFDATGLGASAPRAELFYIPSRSAMRWLKRRRRRSVRRCLRVQRRRKRMIAMSKETRTITFFLIERRVWRRQGKCFNVGNLQLRRPKDYRKLNELDLIATISATVLEALAHSAQSEGHRTGCGHGRLLESLAVSKKRLRAVIMDLIHARNTTSDRKVTAIKIQE